MKKTIYSLSPLRELLLAANRRYLEFISSMEDDRVGTDKLNKISQPVEESDRAYRGFNFFDPTMKSYSALSAAASSTSADFRTRICVNGWKRKPAAKPPGCSSASGFMG